MTAKAIKGSASTQHRWAIAFFHSWLNAWDRFWFSARAPETLALIRICCGAMMTYIHCIWLSQLPNFMGPQAWIDGATVRELHRQDWAWSWLFYVENPVWLYVHQVLAIAFSLCMTLGLFSRLAIPLTWWMTLMVCHRMTGALFGLDQVVMMLSMYLIWSRCGSLWSVDAMMTNRRTSSRSNRPLFRWLWPTSNACIANNIATRLIQLHLCIIYLFGGLSKMRGEMWWDGSAMWFSIVNYEYQSLNLTWLGHFPIVIGLMTAGTIFWETYYCALVWPKLTRPIALGLALLVHGGICIALGMWTFGTMMIVANTAFVSPDRVRQLAYRVRRGQVTRHG